jgi:hypothetical protein
MLTYHRVPVEITLEIPEEIDPRGLAVVIMQALATLPMVVSVRTTGQPVEVAEQELIDTIREYVDAASDPTDDRGVTVVVTEQDQADHTLN